MRKLFFMFQEIQNMLQLVIVLLKTLILKTAKGFEVSKAKPICPALAGHLLISSFFVI